MRPFLFFMACVVSFSSVGQSTLDRLLNNDTMPNLVPNPGFEEFQRLQCRWTQNVEKFNAWMLHWNSPTQTTPDHFSTQLDVDCWAHPSKRTNGKASPHSGNCMMGIKTWGTGNTPTFWHEYLQAPLLGPLQKGTRYIAEMWVLRANWSNDASNNLGIVLTDTMIATRDRLPLYITPVANEQDVVKKSSWTKVRGVFDATGIERYLVVGNFYSDDATQRERMPEGERGAYYFIDDVNVRVAPPGTALTPPPPKSVPPPPKVKVEVLTSTTVVDIPQVQPEVGTSMRLDNIFFEFDKAELKQESEVELNKLADLLTDFPFMTIIIEGHTDDQGSDGYNLKLSDARAKAVVDYLIEKDVEKERLSWKGYGESKPVAANTSEEGRSQNRRVEFRILEK